MAEVQMTLAEAIKIVEQGQPITTESWTTPALTLHANYDKALATVLRAAKAVSEADSYETEFIGRTVIVNTILPNDYAGRVRIVREDVL